MIFGLLLLVIIYLLYIFLVKGLLWKIIIAFGGWFGIMIGLKYYIPESSKECINFSGHSFSWAVIMPTIIILLAMFHTKDE